MTPEIELDVATVWDDAQIATWARVTTPVRGVVSVYGSRQQQLVGHGRAPGDVPAVSDSRIVEHARKARAHGLQFLYLFNGLCRHLDFTEDATRRRFFLDLEWVVEEVKADSLVVADVRVARLIRSRYPRARVGIRVSTIAAVKEPADLEPWLPLDIEGAVLHHDLARDFPRLERMVEFASRQPSNLALELLLNETCPPRCALRDAHYARLARETLNYVEGFQQLCNLEKFREPWLILAAPWIRPEDVAQYHRLGVRRFKIAGREMTRPWLDRAVGAYVAGQYDGNLIDLFTMTPPGLDLPAANIVYLNNRSLEGFLDDLRSFPGGADGVCKRWSRMLWERGNFKIYDPHGRYRAEPDGPRCVEPGSYVLRLIQLRPSARSSRPKEILHSTGSVF